MGGRGSESGPHEMNDPYRPSPNVWIRRLWPGLLGTFLGALAGLIGASLFRADVLQWTFIGALVGFVIGFLAGWSGLDWILEWFR